MTTEEEDSWVFDSLVTFLNGPIWNAPLQSFIEERSLIFEPSDTTNEEYAKIFDSFKNLVDFMLGNFMEDIGITPQQFENACFKGAKEGVPLHFDQNTFEQIWAANDFEMFRRMMTQRNVELQLQALELIERKFGKTPESFIPFKKEDGATKATAEVAHVAPMLKSSNLEKEVLEEVSKQFPLEDTETDEDVSPEIADKEEELKFLDEEKQNLEESLKVAIEEKLSSQKKFLENPSVEEDSSTLPEGEESSPSVTVDVAPIRIPIDRPQVQKVDSVELKKRQEYLRAQRDKLVAMKKEARKKQLDANTNDEGDESRSASKMRPKSAKAAKKMLQLGNLPPISDAQKSLSFRKALAERLKSEVVQNAE